MTRMTYNPVKVVLLAAAFSMLGFFIHPLMFVIAGVLGLIWFIQFMRWAISG